MKKLLRYTIPAILIGFFITGSVWALSVQLPSSIKKGDLLYGQNSSQLTTLPTSTKGSVLWMASTGLPAWTATSTIGLMPVSTGTTGYNTTWVSSTQLGVGSLIDNGTVVGQNATSSTVGFLIQGTAGKTPFVVASSTGTSLLTVLENGNVGIGTTSPSESLEISSNVSAHANILLRNLSASGYEGIDFYNSSGTLSSSLLHANNSAAVLPNSTWLGSRSAEPLYFVTDGVTPRMTILNTSGNVGIGTSGPGAPLDIAGTNVKLRLQGAVGVDAGDSSVEFLNNGTGYSYSIGQDDTSDNFYITTASDLNSGQKVTLTRTGNVGIGTTTPAQVLSVAGNMRLTGALFDSNNASGTLGMVLQSTGTGQQWVATSTLGISGGSLSGGTVGKLAVWSSPSTLTTGLLLDDGTVAGVNATSSTVAFNIQGTGTVDPLRVGTSTNTGMLIVKGNTGYVGIGNTPSFMLQVGTSATQYFAFDGSLATNNTIVRRDSNSTSQNNLFIIENRGVSAANNYATIQFNMNSGAGGGIEAGAIKVISQGAWNSGASRDSDMALFTTLDQTSSEKLRVTSSGNVGIGTTSPSESLEISSNVSAHANILLRNLSASGYEGIDFYNSSGTLSSSLLHANNSAAVLPNSTWLGSRSAEPLYFVTDGVTPRMTILNTSGNVGIGTTAPSSKLQVYGNLSVATSSTPALFVNTATQKVGVGTSTPATDLVVIGTITQTNQLSCSLGLTSDATGAINGCVASDIRLKKNILDLSFNANILNQITPVTYYWKYPATKDKNQHAGFVAQDVKKVFPQAVVPAGSGYLGVDSNSMLAYLWKFTQVFNKQFTDFKTSIVIRMNEQDKKIQSQQKQLDKLQQQINMLLEERAKGK